MAAGEAWAHEVNQRLQALEEEVARLTMNDTVTTEQLEAFEARVLTMEERMLRFEAIVQEVMSTAGRGGEKHPSCVTISARACARRTRR